MKFDAHKNILKKCVKSVIEALKVTNHADILLKIKNMKADILQHIYNKTYISFEMLTNYLWIFKEILKIISFCETD